MKTHTHSSRTNTLNSSFIPLLLLLAMAFAVPYTARAANLVQNPGFETGTVNPWYVTGDGANMFVSSADPNSGTYAFNGSPTGAEGYLNQDFSTLGSSKYSLSFYVDQENTNGNYFEVQWDGATIFQLNKSPQTGYQLVQINGLQATGADTLTFGFIGSNQSSWYLDDVDLEQTPEPGSLMLLGSGALGMAAVVRRRIFS